MRPLFAILCLVAVTAHAETAAPRWDMEVLAKPPVTYPADPIRADGLKAVFFDGLSYGGKPTRVFAWIGVPKTEPGKTLPGIVLVHGGGGTAFESWVRLWNARGYAAIAMDTCGAVPLQIIEPTRWQRYELGGPPGWGGWDQIDAPQGDQWTYHAVADAILAHSLLRAEPGVDPERIGLTGISWGGYLTCIIAGVDTRFKFAAPVYGCGFTDEHGFTDNVKALGPERYPRWMQWWDPSVYLPSATLPMLWVNGTNDFAYTMNAWQKSYRLPSGAHTLCLRPRMPHGHGPAGEGPKEIQIFADSILTQGAPLPKITGQGREARNVWATYQSGVKITKAELNFTKDTGSWQKRLWEAVPAEMTDGRVTAVLPEGTKVYYLNLTDERDCVASSEHEEVDL